jgi:hypothetical protein
MQGGAEADFARLTSKITPRCYRLAQSLAGVMRPRLIVMGRCVSWAV